MFFKIVGICGLRVGQQLVVEYDASVDRLQRSDDARWTGAAGIFPFGRRFAQKTDDLNWPIFIRGLFKKFASTIAIHPYLRDQLVDGDGYRGSLQLDDDMLSTGRPIANVYPGCLGFALQLRRVVAQKLVDDCFGMFCAFRPLPKRDQVATGDRIYSLEEPIPCR